MKETEKRKKIEDLTLESWEWLDLYAFVQEQDN